MKADRPVTSPNALLSILQPVYVRESRRMTGPRPILGDCVEAMRTLPECSVDAVVTDPPYGINFMGKAWDGADIRRQADQERAAEETRRREGRGVFRLTGSPDSPARKTIERSGSSYATAAGAAGSYDFTATGNRAFQAWTEQWAAEAFRVLKPGGHMLVFGGTRTYHRMAAGIEDAGFEIRDCLAWMYGSGFPKSLDVSKQIDKAAGAEREVVGTKMAGIATPGDEDRYTVDGSRAVEVDVTVPATDDAKQWDGWGTALKPAFEPVVVARKPLAGTVAANVLEHGTGALNIDGCRIEGPPSVDGASSSTALGLMNDDGWQPQEREIDRSMSAGRWPANVILDEEAAAILDEQTGELPGPWSARGTDSRSGDGYGGWAGGPPNNERYHGETGGASRFFYCAKVSAAERNAGLGEPQGYEHSGPRGHMLNGDGSPRPRPRPRANVHPTVKPLALMRWLLRLVTPPDGTILDPFLGSGTTGCAAALEGFQFVGIERETDYMAIAEARIAFWREHGEDGLTIVKAAETAAAARAEVKASGQTDIFDMLEGEAA